MTVLLFARARDLVGADRIVVESVTTVAELRRRLARRYPEIGGLLQKSAIAVDGEIADDSALIPVEAEVALLPPVSGG